jgi:hypothetical protein
MNPGPGDPLLRFASRASAAQIEFDAQARRFEDARAQLRATLEQLRKGRPRRDMLRDSAFARLQAKLDTMPVIEQAKGVLMAQNHCGPDEAFELLRRASQRANVKVSVLAAQIVERVVSPEPERPASLPTSGGTARKTARGDGSSSGRPGARSVSGSRDHALAAHRDADSGSRPRPPRGRPGR